MSRYRAYMGLAVVGLLAAGGVLASNEFDHLEHAGLFPRCANCHAGIEDTTRSVWPSAAACAQCHDGTVEDTVAWVAPEPAAASNLAFTHLDHRRAVLEESADSTVTCEDCHSTATSDSLRMTVERTAVQRCLNCHEITQDHLGMAPDNCATCHLPLAEATGLTMAQIAEFSTPPDHDAADFTGSGHGSLARPSGATYAVAPSCATCHAQDFCFQCHVDAPEQEVIQALARDPRSLAITATLARPESHDDSEFYRGHGPSAISSPETCQACHTQESCLECHATRPTVLLAMYPAGPDRGTGAVVERIRPPTHGHDFSLIHADPASAAPETCAACHTRTQCLDCHRPDPGASDGGFHPFGYLSLHPVSAYNQETECADCHNTGQFCASCHVNAGVVATGPLKAGYHDSKQFFSLGHGQAARQNLESCVACHAERDCLTCHSALGGRRFNPHGPDFDADRMRAKNPQMCSACHGLAIPGG
jgi:hypothetical protein